MEGKVLSLPFFFFLPSSEIERTLPFQTFPRHRRNPPFFFPRSWPAFQMAAMVLFDAGRAPSLLSPFSGNMVSFAGPSLPSFPMKKQPAPSFPSRPRNVASVSRRFFPFSDPFPPPFSLSKVEILARRSSSSFFFFPPLGTQNFPL